MWSCDAVKNLDECESMSSQSFHRASAGVPCGPHCLRLWLRFSHCGIKRNREQWHAFIHRCWHAQSGAVQLVSVHTRVAFEPCRILCARRGPHDNVEGSAGGRQVIINPDSNTVGRSVFFVFFCSKRLNMSGANEPGHERIEQERAEIFWFIRRKGAPGRDLALASAG